MPFHSDHQLQKDLIGLLIRHYLLALRRSQVVRETLMVLVTVGAPRRILSASGIISGDHRFYCSAGLRAD